MQLDFPFEDKIKHEIQESEIEKLKTELKNLRRGLFGRYDDLQKEVKALKSYILSLETKLNIETSDLGNHKLIDFPFELNG